MREMCQLCDGRKSCWLVAPSHFTKSAVEEGVNPSNTDNFL
jgi:hypothetical protein